MKRTYLLITLLVILVVLIGALISFVASTAPAKSPSATTTAQTLGTVSSFDASQITNMLQAREVLRQNTQGYFFYKINWANISEVVVDGQKMYFGELSKVSGNGKIDNSPVPVFLVKGILYTPNGFGGNTYDLADTNWIWRYKTLEFTNFTPLEMSYVQNSAESLQAFRTATGIDRVNMSLDKDGLLQTLTLTMSGTVKTFTAPFKHVGTVNILTVDEYKDFPDYITYQNKYRKLPGNVTATSSYMSYTGYTVTYPAMINGMKVTKIKDGINDNFYVEDTAYQEDYAFLSCGSNPQQQVGPKSGNPDAIDQGSVSRLVDWGMQPQMRGDLFSFTGPGYFCTLSTYGMFRPNMFNISF